MSIFAKKGPGFSVAPVFGPIARRNANASNAEVEILNFEKYSFEGKQVKARFTAAGAVGLGSAPGLLVNVDPATLARPLADAGARLVGEKIRAVPREAKPSTLKYREVARRAYKAGKPWALERYKARPPGAANSTRIWNDSGTMGQDVRAILDATNTWAIVTPIEGVRNEFVVRALLKRDIPELRSAAMLKKAPEIQAALGDVTKLLVSRPTKRVSVVGKVTPGRLRGR